MGSLKYISVTSPDINNGLGCRATLWISGCNRRCPHCHNQELWRYDIGKPINEAKEEVEKALNKPYIKGLTLSGGDPLDQDDEALKELYEFVSWLKVRFPSKDIWIYSGDYFKHFDGLAMDILKLCDVMVDGPYIHELRDITLPFRGSQNQSIIDLKKTFEKGEVIELEIKN